MTKFQIPHILFLLMILCANPSYGCIEEERQSLLKFKRNLNVSSSSLTSWKGTDCCAWKGVLCDGTTGRVVTVSYDGHYYDNGYPPQQTDVEWISNLTSLQNLTLARLDLSGARNLFQVLTMLPSLSVLHLSYCSLHNTHISPSQINSTRIHELNLSSSSFQDPFPSLTYLDLSSNHFNSSVPYWLGNLKSLQHLTLSGNSFDSIEGGMSMILWNRCSLKSLDLSNNQFINELWETNRNVSGCVGYELETLKLDSNSFYGPIPAPIQSMSNLEKLYLDHNDLNGAIPAWLGKLSRLTWLSLDNNQLSGVIPGSLGQLVDLEWLHLSNNSLGGMISKELTKLNGLHSLNLSYNHLMGNIPKNVGNMKSLASLDLSKNQLSGSIPTSLSNLYSLSYLNLSYNNFSGQIPTGRQLQTLIDPSIYAGNPELCGAPILRKCTDDKLPSDGKDNGKEKLPSDDKDKDNDENDIFDNMWFYIVVMLGYATGLWGVIGVLSFKKWRYAYFRFADDAKDSIYVAVAVKTAYLKRKIGLN